MSQGMMLLAMLLGLFLTLGLGAFAFVGDGGDKKITKRLEAVRERHFGSQEVLAQAQMKRLIAQRENKLDSVVTQFIPNPAELRARLSRTGKDWTLGRYAMVCAGILVFSSGLLLSAGAPVLLALLLGLFLGLGLPHFVVGILIQRRIAGFTTRFPDAIDLMVRGLRSGLPISETVGVVANEIPDPVATEFRNVADKMKIGRTMEAALQETSDRLATPEFQFFVISLAIQRETGGNLAETLSNLSDVLRKRAAMKLKIRAMSSESKASAYIIGALPFIVFGLIWFINGAYMQNFFVDERLMIAGAGGMVWMGIGAFIMAKMINFEI